MDTEGKVFGRGSCIRRILTMLIGYQRCGNFGYIRVPIMFKNFEVRLDHI